MLWGDRWTLEDTYRYFVSLDLPILAQSVADEIDRQRRE